MHACCPTRSLAQASDQAGPAGSNLALAQPQKKEEKREWARYGL